MSLAKRLASNLVVELGRLTTYQRVQGWHMSERSDSILGQDDDHGSLATQANAHGTAGVAGPPTVAYMYASPSVRSSLVIGSSDRPH